MDTGEVTAINTSGATFTGIIRTLGATPVSDHGFTWSTTPHSLVDNSSQISLGPRNEIGPFSATATFAMEADKVHYVRAYARAGEYVVYGPAMPYTSKGSMTPVITGFSPASARRNDQVTITGSNFTQDLNRLTVLFGSTPATIVRATPESIVCMVPYNLQAPQTKITVKLAGKTATTTNNFTLIP
ncbi:IPT/TIG domain-containing protein [Pontibacter amylolyticus]|nr:IPT/TIG domain-containing protein [Pontibacter amylolyticus]